MRLFIICLPINVTSQNGISHNVATFIGNGLYLADNLLHILFVKKMKARSRPPPPVPPPSRNVYEMDDRVPVVSPTSYYEDTPDYHFPPPPTVSQTKHSS